MCRFIFLIFFTLILGCSSGNYISKASDDLTVSLEVICAGGFEPVVVDCKTGEVIKCKTFFYDPSKNLFRNLYGYVNKGEFLIKASPESESLSHECFFYKKVSLNEESNVVKLESPNLKAYKVSINEIDMVFSQFNSAPEKLFGHIRQNTYSGYDPYYSSWFILRKEANKYVGIIRGVTQDKSYYTTIFTRMNTGEGIKNIYLFGGDFSIEKGLTKLRKLEPVDIKYVESLLK